MKYGQPRLHTLGSTLGQCTTGSGASQSGGNAAYCNYGGDVVGGGGYDTNYCSDGGGDTTGHGNNIYTCGFGSTVATNGLFSCSTGGGNTVSAVGGSCDSGNLPS